MKKNLNLIKIAATLILILMSVPYAEAQSNEEILFRVVDSETAQPISYATIQFVTRGGGMVANVDGGFRLPITFYEDKEQLMISSMGYKTQTLKVENASLTTINEIQLEVRIEELEQVVIQGKKGQPSYNVTPEEVVRKAILKIPDNYPNSSYSTIGYYRDYQLVNDEYYNLNEALIESFDAGFQTDVVMDAKSQSAIYKYNENQQFKRDSILASVYDGETKYIENTIISGQGGNELGILNIHNPIRNFDYQSFSFIYHFKTRFLPNHDLISMKSIYFDDNLIYEISFRAKENLTGTSHKATGRIYIAQDSFAFYKIYYKVKQTRDQKTVFEVDIQYQNVNDLMYLSYITFNNQFTMDEQFKFDVEGISFDVSDKSMYVTFNNDIDASTVSKKDFRFKYSRKKLLVEEATVEDPRTVKLVFAEWSLPQELLNTGNEASTETDQLMEKFSYRIKNVYDVGQRKLFQAPTISGFQYREYFVQKVNESAELPEDLSFINKRRPLKESSVNQVPISSDFWLNTPLKN